MNLTAAQILNGIVHAPQNEMLQKFTKFGTNSLFIWWLSKEIKRMYRCKLIYKDYGFEPQMAFLHDIALLIRLYGFLLRSEISEFTKKEHIPSFFNLSSIVFVYNFEFCHNNKTSLSIKPVRITVTFIAHYSFS